MNASLSGLDRANQFAPTSYLAASPSGSAAPSKDTLMTSLKLTAAALFAASAVCSPMLHAPVSAQAPAQASAQASAQTATATITAKNPAELTIVLMNAGYEAQLTTDGVGDPMIASILAGMPLRS
jgi:hypothetical protein